MTKLKKLTGKQINKCGDCIANQEKYSASEYSEAMDILSQWRYAHEAPLESALEMLKNAALKSDSKAIVAKRLKRTASIKSKLKRFPNMNLKTMQDVGGCRAILSNKKKLNQVVRELRAKSEFKGDDGSIRCSDYISNPKDDGYRGYHLIGSFEAENNSQRKIEIQVRTQLQHDWATSVEIIDLFTGQSLKTNQGEEIWRNFFVAVSEQFAIMDQIPMFDSLSNPQKYESYAREVYHNDVLKGCLLVDSLANKLKVVKKLEAFAHGLEAVESQADGYEPGSYALLEINTRKGSIHSYYYSPNDSESAVLWYTDLEKEAQNNEDIVVALVSTSAVNGLNEAYPNYFADSKEFVLHLRMILFLASRQGPNWLRFFRRG